MLARVCIGSNDLDRAREFYDAVLGAIGMQRVHTGPHELAYAGDDGHASVWVVEPFNEQPASNGNGTQFAFFAADEQAVGEFHAAALRVGGSDEGQPGPRDYQPGYYGAYVRDPDGNKLHAAIRFSG